TEYALPITGLTTSCYGICDATAVGTGSGGQPPYVSYEWSDVPDFSNIIATTDTVDLCAGTFYLRITDSHGCTAIDSVTVGEPPEIIIDSDTVVHNVCYGDSIGKIALAFSGGTGALQYTINGTDWYNSGDTIENLGAGDYVVSIEDATGCTKDTLITITEPTSIDISTTVTPITCFEADDGQIEITATGGTPGVITPYQYSIDSAATWNPGNIFAPLSPDTFYIAVQDSLGCIQYGDTVFMNYPDTISIDSVSISHVICDGTAVDGEIVIHANGGSGDLSYSINNGTDYFPDSLFTGLSGGNYQIAVQDERGCTKLLDSLVTVNGPIVITSDTVVHNQCYGDSIGRIALAFTGGTGALQYTINGTDWYNSGDTIENLGAGDYVVSIEDASGCAKDTLITITEPTPIDITTTYTGISCNGSNDGQIEITATGGTPGIINPYEYSIDSAQTWQFSNIFGSLSNDTFYVAVQDSLGCVHFGDTITINEPDTIVIDSIITVPYSCFGEGDDGEIIVYASGGVGELQFSLTGDPLDFQADSNFTGLIGGTYSIYIEDDCGVDTFENVAVISGPIPIAIDSINITDVSTCYGDNTGRLEIYGSGGSGVFEYSIDNGNNYQSSNIFTGLSAGSFTIYIRDDKGCLSPDSTVTINEPDSLQVTSLDIIDASECNPDMTGSITIHAIGGTGSYEFNVNGGTFQSDSAFSGLDVGSHTFIVRDANGCETSIDTAINIIDPLTISFDVTGISCNGDNDGEISVTPQNGTPGYTYEWETGEFTSTINNLSAGWYTVTVSDSNVPQSCEIIDSVEITEPDLLELTANEKDIFCINSKSLNRENSNGKINVSVTGGTPSYSYNWTGPSGFTSGSYYITDLDEGNYHLTVTDANNCELTYSTSISKDNTYDISFSLELEDSSICWNEDLIFNSTSNGADTIFIQKYQLTGGVWIASDWFVEITDNEMSFSDDALGGNSRYDIEASNDYCYEDTSDISVVYYPDRELNIVREEEGRDTIVIKGENGRWEAMASVNNSNGLIVNWSPTEGVSAPDSLFTRITPTESIWYTVEIITQEGDCTDADSIYVDYVPDIVTYDGFSPNGDGINDFWYIENIDKFKNNVVTVYNRWGTKVYEQKGYSNDDSNRRWDGTAKNGKAVGSGTYYYVIILNEEGFSPLTGAITIMR
ncbi:MAG: gliding motility-associated C-terminal domain-containing protein, partial [Bacteroidota bacterium]